MGAATGQFAWDHWERWALADGVDEELAALGRAVAREACQQNWPAPLRAEAGWEDHGQAMLRLAKEQPEQARVRWRQLLQPDGDTNAPAGHPLDREPPSGPDSHAFCVLSRRTGQSIWIGDEVEVTVVAIEGDRVRLGVSGLKPDAEPSLPATPASGDAENPPTVD
jgi:hypothetical protein